MNLIIYHWIPGFVIGTVAIGIGYTQLAEFFGSLDVPYINPNTWAKYIDILSKNFKTKQDTMKLPGTDEKRLALEASDIYKDDIRPCFRWKQLMEQLI